MSEKRLSNKTAGMSRSMSNVDTGAIAALTSVVAGHDDDIDKFVGSGALEKALHGWSYFGAVNDHKNYANLTKKLAKVCAKLLDYSDRSDNETRDTIVKFYHNILHEHLKLVYRNLSINRAALTNNTLNLLTSMIKFDKNLAQTFLDKFDLNLAVLPKLLVPSKVELDKFEKSTSIPGDTNSITRYCFIKFWLGLNSRLPSFIRKDLLINQYKIMNMLWKYMGTVDSVVVLTLLVDFMDENILNESNFKKATKCKILNENFMFKVQALFNRTDVASDENFISKLRSFVLRISTDFDKGLVFQNHRVWLESDAGVSVVYNNKTFKINNKLILSLLTSLKPWESQLQLEISVKILGANQELIAPYMNWMVQNGGGYHDPSLSSWWISHSLFFAEILNLTITSFQPSHKINNTLLVESICLAPLSKNALKKCLDSKHKLVRQLALQLIYFMVSRTLKLLAANATVSSENFNKQELLELVIMSLPDFSSLSQLMINLYKESPSETDEKLTKLTLVMILNNYQLLYPSSSQPLNKLVNSVVNTFVDSTSNQSNSGYNLTLLDNLLSIQFNQQQEQNLKWWSKTTGTNSFFTCLLKLSSNTNTSEVFIKKYVTYLEFLTENTLLFNKDVLGSPISALLQLLRNNDFPSRLWSLFDEIINRAIVSPYKYLDVSHKKFKDISLLAVVLGEQFDYLLKDSSLAHPEKVKCTEWLIKFMKHLLVIGEPKEAVINLLQDLLVENDMILEFGEEENIEAIIVSHRNCELDGSLSFLDCMINTTNSSIVKKWKEVGKMIPISDFDFAGLLYRLKLMIQSEHDVIPQHVLNDMVTKMETYFASTLTGDTELLRYFMLPKFWKFFFFDDEEETKKEIENEFLIVASVLSGILRDFTQTKSRQDVETKASTSKLETYIFNVFNLENIIKVNDQHLFGLLAWVLSDHKVKLLLIDRSSLNSILNVYLYNEVISRKMRVSVENFNQVLKLTQKPLADTVPDTEDGLRDIPARLLQRDLVFFNQTELKDQIDKILNNKSYNYLLKYFILHDNQRKRELKDYLMRKVVSDEIVEEEPILRVAFFVSSCLTFTDKDDSTVSDFFEKVVPVLQYKLNEENFGADEDWDNFLTVATKGLSLKLIPEAVESSLSSRIFAKVESKGSKKAYLSKFAKLCYLIVSSTSVVSEQINVWIHKSILFITKKITETPHESDSFKSFMKEIQTLIAFLDTLNVSIWDIVPSSVLNSQLEAILSSKVSARNSEFLEFADCLIMISNDHKKVQFERLLQIFINNDVNILNDLPKRDTGRSRYLSSLLIYNLYFMGPKPNSTSMLLEKLTLFYEGSIRAEDLMIKAILVKIESIILTSWAALVTSWDFSEDLSRNGSALVEENKLVSKNQQSLSISLTRRFVKNSIKHAPIETGFFQLPESLSESPKAANFKQKWSQVEQMYDNNSTRISQSYEETIYDFDFLMLLIINNSELVQISTTNKQEEDKVVKFDVRKLVDSSLLQLIVMGLAQQSNSTQQISKLILRGVLKSIESNPTGKELSILKVYLSNILFTLKTEDGKPTPLIWYTFSCFIPILMNPCHHLYERTFRYLLSHPMIDSHKIPLYHEISKNLLTDLELKTDDYYKQLSWLLNVLLHGIRSPSDLDLLNKEGVVEWLANLLNSQYLSMNSKFTILNIIAKIQNIDNGSHSLITKYASLATLESLQLQSTTGSSYPANENQKNLHEIFNLNIDQLSLRFGISAGSSKRVRAWSNDNLSTFVKRVHLSS